MDVPSHSFAVSTGFKVYYQHPSLCTSPLPGAYQISAFFLLPKVIREKHFTFFFDGKNILLFDALEYDQHSPNGEFETGKLINVFSDDFDYDEAFIICLIFGTAIRTGKVGYNRSLSLHFLMINHLLPVSHT